MTENASENPRIGFAAGVSSLLSSIFFWPAFAILLVVIFWKPIHQLGDLAPRLVENSDTVTIGSLTVQVHQNLKALEGAASPEVRDALSGMDVAAAQLVLNSDLQGTMSYSGNVGEDLHTWRRLQRLGLVVELSTTELREEEKKNEGKPGEYVFAIRPTARYDKVHKFLTTAVLEIASASFAYAPATEKK